MERVHHNPKASAGTSSSSLAPTHPANPLPRHQEVQQTSQHAQENRTTVGMRRKKLMYKVIVIGDTGVGKTCLTFRFCSGHFPGTTEATIGVDFREKVITVDNEEVRLQLWDTAGQERFRRSMVSHYYRNVHGVVFVYDVTRKETFESMSFWIGECEKHGLKPNQVPMLMVGNKCDQDSLAVATNEAQKLADSHEMPLFETSAKDDSRSDHVDAIFMTLAHKIRQSRPMMNASQQPEQDPESRVLYKTEAYVTDDSGFCC